MSKNNFKLVIDLQNSLVNFSREVEKVKPIFEAHIVTLNNAQKIIESELEKIESDKKSNDFKSNFDQKTHLRRVYKLSQTHIKDIYSNSLDVFKKYDEDLSDLINLCAIYNGFRNDKNVDVSKLNNLFEQILMVYENKLKEKPFTSSHYLSTNHDTTLYFLVSKIDKNYDEIFNQKMLESLKENI